MAATNTYANINVASASSDQSENIYESVGSARRRRGRTSQTLEFNEMEELLADRGRTVPRRRAPQAHTYQPRRCTVRLDVYGSCVFREGAGRTRGARGGARWVLLPHAPHPPLPALPPCTYHLLPESHPHHHQHYGGARNCEIHEVNMARNNAIGPPPPGFFPSNAIAPAPTPSTSNHSHYAPSHVNLPSTSNNINLNSNHSLNANIHLNANIIPNTHSNSSINLNINNSNSSNNVYANSPPTFTNNTSTFTNNTSTFTNNPPTFTNNPPTSANNLYANCPSTSGTDSPVYANAPSTSTHNTEPFEYMLSETDSDSEI